jgi:hypothetical protein
VRLSNVLPLKNGQGLDPRLDLYVLDKQRIREGETIRFEIRIPNTRYNPSGSLRGRNMKSSGNYGTGKESTERSRSSNGTTSNAPHRVLGPMKITICWYDPPAPLGSSRNLLMHDLDLVVLSPDGSLHWGNANRGQDLHSSEDTAKSAERKAGDPFGSNSSFPGWAWADDSNPNEQVYIPEPHCPARSKDLYCTYIAYIHTDILPYRTYQNFAVIVTSPGIVSEPTLSDKWFDDIVDDSANRPPAPPKLPTYFAGTVAVTGGLAGGELVSTSKLFDECAIATLQTLHVDLVFSEIQGTFASPNNLELTIGNLSYCVENILL